ncbi:MAG: leucine-rich repeat domain-containing protein [Bacteroidales bacterium]|nr:leucine-rich repeat domain-containing protein [Bacteroidales bacterium]
MKLMQHAVPRGAGRIFGTSDNNSILPRLLLSACFFGGIGLTQTAHAEVISGTPDDNPSVTYSYDTETRTLTVTGEGATGYPNGNTYSYLLIHNVSLFEMVEKIVIGEGITRIDGVDFAYCGKVTEIVLPSTLQEIGNSAFKGCVAMPEIVVPDNVWKVEDDAFCDWDGATRLHIGKSLTEFGTVAFAACDNLREIDIDPANQTFETRGCNGIFKPGCDTLLFGIGTTVIPEGIHVIGKNAFIRTDGVKSVKFPSTLKEIGDHAFSENYKLESITFADSIETICDFAFWHCEALAGETLQLPKRLRSLGGESFGYGPKFKHIVCGDSLRYIGSCPFDLNDYETIDVGNHLEYAEYGAFWTPKLKSIHLPATLKGLGIEAFGAAENLERIDIDDIDAWCHIQMGSQRSNPAHYGRIYLNGEPVTRIVVPEDIVELSGHIFHGFTDLTEVILPIGLHSIGEGAFSNCTSLAEVHIPPSVFEMGGGIVGSAPSIKKVYLYSHWPGNTGYDEFLYDVYAEKPEYPTIYVPTGSTSAYMSAPTYSEACNKGMVISEFDMAEESPLAPALPAHLYLLNGEKIASAKEFTRNDDGTFTLSAYMDGSTVRFIQDKVNDWAVINFRDYFPYVAEWDTYTGGTFLLDIDEHGCYLANGIYDFVVNLRTMQCKITACSRNVADLKSDTSIGNDITDFAPYGWDGATGTYARDGRTERYQEWMFTGDVMTQTIDGLVPGTRYEVILEAAASYTSGRDFEGKTGWGLTEIFANEGTTAIEVIDRVDVDAYQTYSIVGTVDENGNLTYGIRNVTDGGNWFVVQLNSVKVTDKPVSTTGISQVSSIAADGTSGKRLIGQKLVLYNHERTYNVIGQEIPQQ